jgi:hypothetical protein
MVSVRKNGADLEEEKAEACARAIQGKVIEGNISNEKRIRKHRTSHFNRRFSSLSHQRTNEHEREKKS